MAIIMPTITLNDVEDDIKLPMIFAYADDIVLLSDKREVIGEMLGVLKPLLLTVGLQLNTAKSNVLIRNPLRVEDRDTDQVERFGNERLKVEADAETLQYYDSSSGTVWDAEDISDKEQQNGA
jgi:hypothetical protein